APRPLRGGRPAGAAAVGARGTARAGDRDSRLPPPVLTGSGSRVCGGPHSQLLQELPGRSRRAYTAARHARRGRCGTTTVVRSTPSPLTWRIAVSDTEDQTLAVHVGTVALTFPPRWATR